MTRRVRAVHAQNKKVLYTAGISSKIFVKKEGKFGDLIYDHGLWCQFIFIKIYYVITACTTYTFTFVKC